MDDITRRMSTLNVSTGPVRKPGKTKVPIKGSRQWILRWAIQEGYISSGILNNQLRIEGGPPGDVHMR